MPDASKKTGAGTSTQHVDENHANCQKIKQLFNISFKIITLILINTLVCPFRNTGFKTQQTELFLINILFASHERELKCRNVHF